LKPIITVGSSGAISSQHRRQRVGDRSRLAHPVRCGYLGCGLRHHVEHAHQFRVRMAGKIAGMHAADATTAKHGETDHVKCPDL